MSVDDRSTSDPSLGTLVANVTANVSSLIRLEIELLKSELAAQAKSGAAGLVAVVVAAALGAMAVVLGSFAAVYGFAHVMPIWAAFLVVAGIYLVVAAILAFTAMRRFRRVRGPRRAKAQVDLTKRTLTEHMHSRGATKAIAPTASGGGPARS